MAGTRRSTRQSVSTAPKYTEPDSAASEDEAPKRNAKKATRRKRVREEVDDDNVNEDDSPPPKKAAKSKARASKPASKPAAKPTKQAVTSTSTTTGGTPSSLDPSSPSNRTASGAQEIYWLLKSEPLPRYQNGTNVSFSISDLAACTVPEPWSGVRNPLACKNMRAMRAGDLGFFYHSNAKPSGVAGILRIVEEAKVDESAFDDKDAYFDKGSKRENPRWWCVGVEFVKEFAEVVDLATLKGHAEKGGVLENMQLVKQGRLSVNRVRKEEWDFILGLAGENVEEGEGETEVENGKAGDVE